jgi:tetratricopeptide (TPR) repeat protein
MVVARIYRKWKQSEQQNASAAQIQKLKAAFDKNVARLSPELSAIARKAWGSPRPDPRPDYGSNGENEPCWKRWYPGKCMAKYKDKVSKGEAEEEMAKIDEVHEQNPNDLNALQARAALHNEMGDLAGAHEDSRRVLEIDPNNPSAFAIYKLTEGREKASIPDLKKLDAENRALDALAGALRPSMGALALASRNSAAENAVKAARERLALGDHKAALANLDRAIEADPRSVEAYRLRALTNARSGRYGEALADAESGLALAPKDPVLFVAKAFAQNRTKDYRGALISATQALELDPQNADAMANYAYAVGGLGNREQMMTLLSEAARRDPRYLSSLESAKNMPEDSDILFLFPGESGSSARLTPAADSGAKNRSREKRFGFLAIATLIGGFLVALGLLQSVALPLAERVKTALTGKGQAGIEPQRAADPVIGSAASAPRVEGGLLRDQYKVQIGRASCRERVS